MVTFSFLEVQNMEVAVGRPIPLEKALELLHRENAVASEEEIEMYFAYSLVEGDSELVQGELIFPIEDFNLLNEIQKDLLNTVDGESEEIQDFISYLTGIFPKENQRIPEKKKTKINKEKALKTGFIKKQSTIFRRFWIAFFFVLFLMLSFAVTKIVPNFMNEKVPSYQELMASEDYETAAKIYPEKVDTIENALYENVLEDKNEKTMAALKAFSETNETTFGNFDLAILNANYSEAVEIYEENPKNFSNENDRLELVGYAYLKIDNIEKAKELSEQTKSIALEEKIFSYEQLVQAIEEKDNELEELAKGGSKNREKAEAVAKEKFSLKEELLKL